jgi:type III secretion protein V
MSLETYYRTSSRPVVESTVARYSDLILVAGVIAIVALMIMPLPPLAIDSLVALNIICGVMLLLVSIYIAAPLEFSVFPSVLLITTLFRLSLAIATTRLILLEGHAGHIIDTFGNMVAGGNLVVGLVTFLIITVVQFIVIAKGAERVAEVAARFSLDAMPGKQLSIDSDLRSGIIDKTEARRKRRTLELESKLHGSLDGAMKFVKGDAIAGIVIIVINLLGGLAVGVLQQGMDMSAAVFKYSILTIGDGLVSQIPALLGAMAAGLIVTRTTDDQHDRHLGDAIRKQIAAKPRVLLVAGGITVLLAMVPGFPAAIFLAVGAVVGTTGALLTPTLRERFLRITAPARDMVAREPSDATAMVATTSEVAARSMVPLLLELTGAGSKGLKPEAIALRLEPVLQDFQLRLGVTLPRVAVHVDPARPESRWTLFAYEVPIAQGEVADAGGDAIAQAAREALRRNCALFVGSQEVGALLTRASEDMPELVKEAMRVLPVPRHAEIFRRLVEEEVPLRNLRDLLEGLTDASQREKDPFALTEFARIALKRYLSHRYAPDGLLRTLLIAPELENHLRQSVRVVAGVQQLSIDPAFAQQLIAAISAEVARSGASVILTTVDIRRHVRKLIEPELFDVAVLSYHELVPTMRIDVAGRVGLGIPAQPQIANEVKP